MNGVIAPIQHPCMVLFHEKIAARRLHYQRLRLIIDIIAPVCSYNLYGLMYIPVGSRRSKIVRIASGLSFFCQDIPIVGAIADAGWKQSSLKCLLHKKLCLHGPFQRSRVPRTCRIHCSLRWSSLGNKKMLTVSRQVLLHPDATQFLTILPAISLFLRDRRKLAVFIAIPYCVRSCDIQLAPLGRHT